MTFEELSIFVFNFSEKKNEIEKENKLKETNKTNKLHFHFPIPL